MLFWAFGTSGINPKYTTINCAMTTYLSTTITECGSTLYLGITMEFLDNWFFDHGIKQANKLQKPTTRLQMDLPGLAVQQNTNKHTVEYTRGEKSVTEKVMFCLLSCFFFPTNFRQA